LTVRTIDVHGGLEHGAVPSSHHVNSLIAVNDRGEKPGGTGPPAGLMTAGTVLEVVVLTVALAVLDDVAVVAGWVVLVGVVDEL
jgi:hypothetical protein